MKTLITLLLALGLMGCTTTQQYAYYQPEPDILRVHEDGRMEYRQRFMPEEDVIIYNDGFGGERAAVRVNVPLKENDYFRDSIRVVREDDQADIARH